MYYYSIISADNIDIKTIFAYVLIYHDASKMAIVRVSDEKIGEFLMLINNGPLNNSVGSNVYFQFVGTDNYRYNFYLNGDKEKNKRKNLKKFLFHDLKKFFKKFENNCRFQKCVDEFNADTLIYTRKEKGFEKYFFLDKLGKQRIDFSLKNEGNIEKKPLVIYFHGAGSMGNNNISQLKELNRYVFRLKKHSCNILAPQAPYGSNQSLRSIENYVSGVKKNSRLSID